MMQAKKRLGQHWLFDEATLQSVVGAGEVSKVDTVLEIGPGLGTLTELLAKTAGQVVAVEKDSQLAADLRKGLSSTQNLEVVNEDIMEFDLGRLPKGYKVVANIPYYLTSNLLRNLLESKNPPQLMALMVQKEVAQRIVADPPSMNLLAFSVQYYAMPRIAKLVPKELFVPAPKVDSAIIQVKRRPRPAFEADTKILFRIVKAGFSSKRKQLKNSLAAGLHKSPAEIENLLNGAGINPLARAQELSMEDWQKLYQKQQLDG